MWVGALPEVAVHVLITISQESFVGREHRVGGHAQAPPDFCKAGRWYRPAVAHFYNSQGVLFRDPAAEAIHQYWGLASFPLGDELGLVLGHQDRDLFQEAQRRRLGRDFLLLRRRLSSKHGR